MLGLEEIIFVWARRELEQKEKRTETWVHPIICDRRKNRLFWTIFEDLRRDEAKIFNYFRMPVDS
jgi:hypothetical protein